MQNVEYLKEIETAEDLHYYLHTAIQLEHATIPPYLTALYSIHPQIQNKDEERNSDAIDILRVVAIEEMLHLTLAANILNAIGGKPDLTVKGFVPDYPAGLPNGEEDFQVGIKKFSLESLEGFLKIERPKPPQGTIATGTEKAGLKKGKKGRKSLIPKFKTADHDEYHFATIGLFYEAIEKGLVSLAEKIGEKRLFCGDESKQVKPDQMKFYFNGGGQVIKVTDLKTARDAIRLITEQGEGFGETIYDEEGELSHYYRFQQLLLGRYYQKGDTAESGPKGPKINIDWNAVYPIYPNLKLRDVPKNSELYNEMVSFNKFYKDFLIQLTEALNGEPEKLLDALKTMTRHISKMVGKLVANPIPGKNANASPTFEVDLV